MARGDDRERIYMLRRTADHLLGKIRYGIDNITGRPTYTTVAADTGREAVYTSFEEAQAQLPVTGLRRRHVFDPSDANVQRPGEEWKFAVNRPRSGHLRFRELEQMAEAWDEQARLRGGRGFIVREDYTTNDLSEEYFKKTFFRDEGGKRRPLGLVNAEPGKLTALRFYRRDSRGNVIEEVFGSETEGIQAFLKKHQIDLFQGDKLSKRWKALLSERSFSIAGPLTGPGAQEPWKVGVFDPLDEDELHANSAARWRQRFMKAGEDVARRARASGNFTEEQIEQLKQAEIKRAAVAGSDGQIRAGKSFFQRFAKEREREINDLRSQAAQLRSAGQYEEAAQTTRMYEQMGEELKRFKADLKMGKTPSFNTRLSVQTAHMIDPFDANNLGGLSGNLSRNTPYEVDIRMMAKGDVIYDPSLNKSPYDFIVSKQSLTGELSFGPEGRFFGSIVEHHHGFSPSYDIQSFISNPGLLTGSAEGDLNEIFENMRKMAQADFQAIRDGGIPAGLAHHLDMSLSEQRMGVDMANSEDYTRWLSRTAHDRTLQQFHRMGFTLADSPVHARRFADQIVESTTLKRRGREIPNMRMVNAIEAGLSTTTLTPESRRAGIKVAEDEIAFSGNRWLIHDTRMSDIYVPIGGGDLDDTLANMIRYNSETKKLVVPIIRRPNARGELSFLNLNVDNIEIHTALNKFFKDDDLTDLIERRKSMQDEADQMRKQASSLRNLADRDERAYLHQRANNLQDSANAMTEQIAKLVSSEEWLNKQVERKALGVFDPSQSLKNIRSMQGVGMTNFVDPRTGTIQGGDPLLRYVKRTDTGDFVPDAEDFDSLFNPQPKAGPEKVTEDWMTKKMDEAFQIQDRLGQYINTRMVIDQWRGHSDTTEVSDAIRRSLSQFGADPADIYKGQIWVSTQERAIDLNILLQEAGAEEYIKHARESMIRSWFHARMGAAPGVDVGGVDPALFEARGGDRKLWEQTFDELRNFYGRQDITFQDFVLKSDDERAIYSRAMEFQQEHKKWVANEAQKALDDISGYGDYIMNRQFSDRNRRDAAIIQEAYKNALAAANLDESADKLVNNAKFAEINRATLSAISTLAEGDDTLGARAYGALGYLMQESAARETNWMLWQTGENLGVGNISMRAMDYYRQLDDVDIAVPEGMNETEFQDYLRDMRAKPVRISDIIAEAGHRGPFSTHTVESIGMLLGDGEIDALRHISTGLRLAESTGQDLSLDQLPAGARALFEPVDTATSIFPEGRLLDPLDPRSLMRIPIPSSGDPQFRLESLGSVVDRWMQSGGPDGGNATLGNQIREALLQQTTAWRSSEFTDEVVSALPAPVRRSFYNAMEVGMDPSQAKAARAARAAQDAAEVAAPVGQFQEYTRMGMDSAKRMWNTKAGRGGILAGAALTAVGLLRGDRESRDHTFEDMQGPEGLPGGNPYTNQPMQQSTPLQTPATPITSQQSGTRYEIRSRGGKDPNELLKLMSELTGASQVTGTKHTVEQPFRSEPDRRRILEQYR